MNKTLRSATLFTNKIIAAAGRSFGLALTLVALLGMAQQAAAQAPTISYAGPQTYTAGTAIPTLAPTTTNGTSLSYTGLNFWGNSEDGNAPQVNNIADAGNGSLYLANGNVLQKFGANGYFQSTLIPAGLFPNSITNMAEDAAGNLYLSAAALSFIYELRKSDGALIKRGKSFSNPVGITVDTKGNVYVSDLKTTNPIITSIKEILAGSDSTITVLANSNNSGLMAIDGANNLYFTSNNYSAVDMLTPGSTTSTTIARLSVITGLTADPAGNVFVANYTGASGVKVNMLAAGTYALTQLASLTTNALCLGLDSKGNLYAGDIIYDKVYKLSPNGGFYAPKIPTGLNFDSNSGTFSGTPVTGSPATDYTIYAYNSSGSTSTTVNMQVSSGNANLDGLYASGATLSPAFTSATTTYTAAVANSITNINITPALSDISGTVTINGTAATTAMPTVVPLSIGNNAIAVTVTSNTGASNTYTLTVFRAYPAPTLSYAGTVNLSLNKFNTPIAPTNTNVTNFGLYLTQTGGIGEGNPIGVVADKAGDVYEADANGQEYETPAGGGATVAIGSGFSTVTGIAIDGAGNLYIADNSNKVVQKIITGTSNVIPLGIGYAFGSLNNVAVNKAGDVYVVDSQNANVVVIPADGSATHVFSSQRTSAGGPANYILPSAVAVDSLGNVYIADASLPQLYKVASSGGISAPFGASFNGVNALAIDAAGDVFVSNAGNNEVDMMPANNTGTIIKVANYRAYGISVDNAGNLYTATASPNAINKLRPSGGYFLTTALPVGITFDYNSGAIGGTPVANLPVTTYTVTAYNPTASVTANATVRVASGNAGLDNLVLSNGTLSPVFATATTIYTASVANAVSSLMVTPVLSDNTATVTVNGSAIAQGASATIALAEGDNTITTIVKAADSTTVTTYTTTVTRAIAYATLANITPATGSLSPGFDVNNTSYTVSGPDVDPAKSISFTINPVDTAATIVVTTVKDGAVVTGNNRVYTVGLNTATRTVSGLPTTGGVNGVTQVKILVTGINGTTQKEYDINVNQVLNYQSQLNNYTISNTQLSPNFDPRITSYTATVPYTTSSVTVTPTAADTTTLITLNGKTTTSGISSNIALNVGDNTITTTVVAQDNSTMTYTTVITRQQALTNAGGLNISNPNGSTALTPAFDPNVTSYTATVINYSNSFEFDAYTTDANATMVVTTANDGAVIAGTGNNNAVHIVNINSSTSTRVADTLYIPLKVVITAADGVSSKEYDVTAHQVLDTNNSLTGLSINSNGPRSLSPAFNADSTNYIALMPSTSTTATINLNQSSSLSTVTVNGTPVARNTAATVTLNQGVNSNVITVAVTAQNGSIKNYIINANYQGPVLSQLNGAFLSPAFFSTTTSYTATVSTSQTSVFFNAFSNDPNAIITAATINNNVALPVDANGGFNVNLRDTTATKLINGNYITPIKVLASSATGLSTEYDVNITQVQGTNDTLSNITLNQGTLSPAFNADSLNYTTTVPSSSTSIGLTLYRKDASATISTNGVSGPTPYVNLVPGKNNVNVVVTAQNGSTLTYKIVATRLSSDATIASLTPSTGSFNIPFDPTQTGYGLDADNTTSSVTFTAVPNDSTTVISGITTQDNSPLQVSGNNVTVHINSSNTVYYPPYFYTAVAINATSTDGTVKTYNVTIKRMGSTNNNLSNITVNTGTLSTPFDPGTTGYNVNIPYSTTSIIVTPTLQDTTATIYDSNNHIIKSGVPDTIALTSAYTYIPFNVHAQSGNVQYYYVQVNRKSDLTLSGVTIIADTAHFPTTLYSDYFYQTSVPSSVSTAGVLITHNDTTTVVQFNNTTVSNQVPSSVTLNPGDNYFNITASGGDGSSMNYTLDINRAYPDVTLSSLAVNPGSFENPFDPNSTFYFIQLGLNDSTATVKPISTDSTAVVSINGNVVARGSTASENLVYGDNYEDIHVSSSDGSTSNDYTVDFFRPSPPPTVSYTGPNVYTQNATISPLTPTQKNVALPDYVGNTQTITDTLQAPTGVAVDKAGNIFMADVATHAVYKIAKGSTTPVMLSNNFNTPLNLAVDTAGNLYVADPGKTSVTMLPANGGAAVSIGSGLKIPAGIAVDAAGNIYVSTFANHSVYKIPAGSQTPVLLSNRFGQPFGLAVNQAGTLYIADASVHSVRVLTAGSTTLSSIDAGGGPWSMPSGVSIDATGNLYVVENGGVNEVPAGSTRSIVLSENFNSPFAAAADGAGNVYVTDNSNSLLAKITPVGGYYVSQQLPLGLTLNSRTGIISGAPLASSPATDYAITAYSNGGGTPAVVNIAVAGPAKLNLNLANVTYGQADYSPAKSNNPVTPVVYTSSNPMVASIVNGQVHIVGTGSTIIGASQAAGNGLAAAPDTSGTLTVVPAPLTITPDNQTANLNEPFPAFTVTYTGFVNGESQSALSVLPTVTTNATAGSPIGAYTLTASGASSPNYLITYNTGKLRITNAVFTFNPIPTQVYGNADFDPAAGGTATYTSNNPAVATIVNGKVHIVGVGSAQITATGASTIIRNLVVQKAKLNIAVVNQTKAYGDANPVPAFTYSGFVNGDDSTSLTTMPVSAITAPVNSPVGNYTVNVSGAASDKYSITYTDGHLTIKRAVLHIAVNAATKTYGDDNPVFTLAYSGFVNNEGPANLSSPAAITTTAVKSSPVGSYPIIATGATDANYDIVYTKGLLAVNKATLNIRADNYSRAQGAANPVLEANYSGFVNGDTTSNLTTLPTVTTTATTASVPGKYPVTASGAVDNNYKIVYTGGHLTVTIATPGFTFGPIAEQTYGQADFKPVVTGTNIIFTSSDTNVATIVNGKIHITGAGSCTITASKGAQSATETLTVDKAILVVKAGTVKRAYGAANPAFTIAYTGFVNGDNANSISAVPTTGTIATAASPVGVYPVVISNGNANNYTLQYSTDSLTVTPANLIVRATPAKRVYGSVNPALTAGYSGFVNGEGPAVLTTVPVVTTTATTASPTGTYSLVASGAAANNYNITYEPGILTVTPARLYVSADSQTRVYGQADPVFTLSYAGFVNGDTQASLITLPVATANTTAASAVGKHPITISGAVDSNYNFTYTTGSLTITKASLNITADNKTMLAGNQLPPLTISYSGFVNGEDSSALTVLPTISTSASSFSGYGIYSIVVSGAKATNYNINYFNGQLKITPQSFASRGSADTTQTNALQTQDVSDGVTVRQAVTPNGDGINDVLVIDGITAYPNNKLVIVNNSGAKVFEVAGYDNVSKVFDGHSNNNALQRAGTYFYKLQYTIDGQIKQKTGYFVLKY